MSTQDDAAFAAAYREWREKTGWIVGVFEGAEWGRSWQAERDAAAVARLRDCLEAFVEFDANYESNANGVNFVHWKRAIENAKAALARGR